MINQLAPHGGLLDPEFENIYKWYNKYPRSNIVTTVPTTLTEAHAGLVLGDTTNAGATVTTTLPAATGNLGLCFTFKKIAGEYDWTIQCAGSDLMDEVTSITIFKDQDYFTIWSDNSTWRILDNHVHERWSYPTVYTKADMGGVAADSTIIGGVVYNDKLYLGTDNSTAATDSTGAKLLVYDGSSWSVITKATMGGVNADRKLSPFAVYDGKLWVGCYNTTAATDSTGAKLFSFDGTTWTAYTKATMGGVAADQSIGGENNGAWGVVYNNILHIPTYNTTAATDSTGAKLILWNGTTWSTITKATMGAHANDYGFCCCVYNDMLCMGTQNTTAATDATASKLIYNDGSWHTVTKATMGGVNADLSLGIYGSIGAFGGKLLMGCYNTTAATDSTGTKLFNWDGSTWGAFYKSSLQFSTNDRCWGRFVVYKDKLILTSYNITVATNLTGSRTSFVDRSIAYSGIYAKSFFGCVGADLLLGVATAIYKGKIWLGTYNATAAIDSTAAKVIAFDYPKVENDNSFTSRGFR